MKKNDKNGKINNMNKNERIAAKTFWKQMEKLKICIKKQMGKRGRRWHMSLNM